MLCLANHFTSLFVRNNPLKSEFIVNNRHIIELNLLRKNIQELKQGFFDYLHLLLGPLLSAFGQPFIFSDGHVEG